MKFLNRILFGKSKPKPYVTSYADVFRPPDTTPITRRRLRPRFVTGLVKLAVIAGAGVYAIYFAPVPTLLWEYQYFGGTAGSPRYHTDCTYIRLDGRYHIRLPPLGADTCPALIFTDRD